MIHEAMEARSTKPKAQSVLEAHANRSKQFRPGHVPGETNNNAADDDHQERPAYPYDKETTSEMSSLTMHDASLLIGVILASDKPWVF